MKRGGRLMAADGRRLFFCSRLCVRFRGCDENPVFPGVAYDDSAYVGDFHWWGLLGVWVWFGVGRVVGRYQYLL